METPKKNPITIHATVQAPIEKVWSAWSEPQHITQWCFATDDWHAPSAENDLRTGGQFKTVMAAKDGSFAFDFGGVYTNVDPGKLIEYELGDGRAVKVLFEAKGNSTLVTETFDPESENPLDMQKAGWQAILNNFKKYTEGNK